MPDPATAPTPSQPAAAAAPEADRKRSLGLAQRALERIMAQGMPADPRNFELWYAYASGHNPALNAAVDARLGGAPQTAPGQLDDIYEQYLAPAGPARIAAIQARTDDEIEQVLASMDTAIDTTLDYGERLTGANRQLGHIRDRTALRSVIETLVSATKHMEERHGSLMGTLQATRDELKKLHTDLDEARSESLTDALTKLANRKGFDRALAKALADSRQSAAPMSLLMCDVDHFKRINDNFGHQMGDHILRLIANTIGQAVRGQDTAARYGGEEFAVILPQTTLQQALAVANNIRGAVSKREVVQRSTNRHIGHITMSIGAAELQAHEDAETLIGRADALLYAAKDCGRDRVMWELPED
jgi:diguanylate cyclase